MSDDIDKANEHAEMFNNIALKQRKPSGPQPTGYCLNCDDPLPIGRWCSPECRDDWEKRERAGHE